MRNAFPGLDRDTAGRRCRDRERGLLAGIRGIAGNQAEIDAAIDPHRHFTGQGADVRDIAIMFKQFPHTDLTPRACERGDSVTRVANGETVRRMASFDCRLTDMVPASEAAGRKFADRISGLKREPPQVLSKPVMRGFLAGEVPEMGSRNFAAPDDAPEAGPTGFVRKLPA